METLGKYLRDEPTERAHGAPFDSSRSQPYPGVFQAVGLLVLFVGVLILLAIPLAIISIHRHNNLILSPVVGVFVTLVAHGIIIAWGFRQTKSPVREVFRFKPVQPGLVLPIALCVLGLIIVSSNVDYLVQTTLPPPKWVTSYILDMLQSRYGLALLSLEFLVLAPITEELLFRGLLLHGFLRRYGNTRAVLASAILFGAIHMNLWQFSYAVLVGLLLGWWFVETRSLVPCIIGHALHNLLALLSIALIHWRVRLRIGDFAVSQGLEPPWLVLTGAIALAAGAYLFVRTVRIKPVKWAQLAPINAGDD